MVRPEVIRKRLQKLDEYLAILESHQRYSLEEFRSEPQIYGSSERFLHLAIESVNDAASHIIAETGVGSIDQYSDIPRIFLENDWIDENLREKWIRMIGFRNVLVHDYLDVDRRIVYDVLQNSLNDIRALKDAMARFL